MVQDYMESPNHVKYGWGTFRPGYLQWLNKSRWFLFFLTSASLLSGIVQLGIRVVILPSIERRFHFTSKEIGSFSAVGNVAGLIATLLTSYVGGYGNKTRWMGCGLLVKGIGCLLHSLPHFISGDYRPEQLALAFKEQELCSVNRTLSPEAFCADERDDGYAWYFFIIFLVAEVLIMSGGAPTVPLGHAYMDENVHPKHFPVYLGIFLTLSALGVGIGQMLGGVLLGTYVDIHLPDGLHNMKPDDPRWVGAWWIGYFVSGWITLLIALVISGFSASLPGSKELREDIIHRGDLPTRDETKGNLAEIIPSTKKLLRNPTFMFNTLAVVVGMFYLSGSAPFIFKYVQLKYGVTPMTVTSGIGVPSVVLTLAGIVVGSFLVRRFQLNEMCHRSTKVCFALSCIAILSTPAFFIPGCRTLEFAGVNMPYWNSSSVHLSIQSSCNNNCSCSSLNYNPVCGIDGITYYGPCQAGCNHRVGHKGFTNCSCIHVPYTSSGQATEGFCDRKCKNFYLFMITLCVGLVCFGMVITPVRTVLIRCVPENQRAYAMGFQVVILKLLAFLPAPVIFGSYFDTKCILWEDSCGSKGSCLYYDKHALDVWLQVISVIATGLGAVFFYFSWRCYKPPPTENLPDSELTEQELLIMSSKH